jgi:hypothetical protein
MKLFTHIFRYLQVPPPTIHRLGAKGYNTDCPKIRGTTQLGIVNSS